MSALWLVVEGSEHGIRIAPEPSIDLIEAVSAEAAALEFQQRHEPMSQGDFAVNRLYVVPFVPQVFALEVLVRAVDR